MDKDKKMKMIQNLEAIEMMKNTLKILEEEFLNELEEEKNIVNKEIDFTNLFTKKKTVEKILVNFTLKENTYKRLITLAEMNNLTLTEVVETTLDAMLDANNVTIDEKAIESFKIKNENRGRPKKTINK